MVIGDAKKPFPNTDPVTSFREQELQNMAEAIPQRSSNLPPLFLLPPSLCLPTLPVSGVYLKALEESEVNKILATNWTKDTA